MGAENLNRSEWFSEADVLAAMEAFSSGGLDFRSSIIRALRAATPTPAMPNGVEGLQRWSLAAGSDGPAGYLERDPGGEWVKFAHVQARAADNRDAAGVCDACGGAGMVGHYAPDGPFGEDCPACAPAAAPAGEAVYEGNPCVECGEDTGTGHFPGCCLGTTPQPADGEASMFAGQSDAQIAHAVRMAEQHYRSLGRDPVYCNVSLSVLRDCTPPAPVQAAPQEGEAITVDWVAGYMPAQVDEGRQWPAGYADGYNAAAAACIEQVRYAFAEWAALQHRGDSQEVGRG